MTRRMSRMSGGAINQTETMFVELEFSRYVLYKSVEEKTHRNISQWKFTFSITGKNFNESISHF